MVTRIFAAAAIFGLFAVMSVDARSQETQLRLATVVNAPHPWIDMAEAFKAEVEDRTEGRMSVEIFPGGSLGNDQTVIDEMRIGTVDFIIGGTQNAAPFIREYQIFSLNYLFDDMDMFRRATDPEGPLFKRLESIHEESGLGLRLLALAGGGTRNFSNNLRPVRTP
ncbi:MAG TPA: TRAP transporter substrate-binding protein DctP, partial [Arenibaculum sp.]|nr:TRAP transporter substrate-binding protein DctP [Arenibaculum sp.]